MKSKSNTALVFALLMLGLACQKEAKTLGEFIFFNDFESQFGYNPNVALGKSHSGRAFFKLDANTEFSPAFIHQFKTIANRGFSKVKFTAYVLMPDPNNLGALVIQVWDPSNQPIKVEQKNFTAKEAGTNRWVELSLELPLAGLYTPENQIRCFVHNPGFQNFYVDDFTVEFVQ